ncbi:hypothetical protein PMAYCL1PPCAC_20819, partial [Pristionchus mayeri]
FCIKENLKRHMSIHTGKKLVECAQSGRYYHTNTARNSDMQIHNRQIAYPSQVNRTGLLTNAVGMLSKLRFKPVLEIKVSEQQSSVLIGKEVKKEGMEEDEPGPSSAFTSTSHN